MPTPADRARHRRASPRDRSRRLDDFEAQGRSSVETFRAVPSSLPGSPLGGWFAGGWRRRLVRRLALTLPVPAICWPVRMMPDIAFWSAVRTAATRSEWRRLTSSSYVVLCYHRLAGLAQTGQERMDVSPAAFRAQLRLLALLGWRPLSVDDLVAFHRDPSAVLPRRRFVLTADDGFADAIVELRRHTSCHPQVFAVTGAVGGRAGWLGDELLADWEALRDLSRSGGVVGSHAREHLPLNTLDEPAIHDQVTGSLDDLRQHLDPTPAVLAYPHGRHDARVRDAARRAGYALAYSTAQGRNGAGADRWSLHRVEPKIWDSSWSFLWKVVTGESPPPVWESRLMRRWEAGRHTAGPRRQVGD